LYLCILALLCNAAGLTSPAAPQEEGGRGTVRRKIFTGLALAALLGMMFASAALAANLGERKGPDNINGGAGRDKINAARFGGDADRVNGGPGNDVLNVDDGDTRDKVIGGPGEDLCRVDSLREVVGKSCETIEGTANSNPKRELREVRRFI
jgi:hypothetical protein